MRFILKVGRLNEKKFGLAILIEKSFMLILNTYKNIQLSNLDFQQVSLFCISQKWTTSLCLRGLSQKEFS